jgi:acyl-CoA synthetase (AMP-forming)/AMP-acid ligase II
MIGKPSPEDRNEYRWKLDQWESVREYFEEAADAAGSEPFLIDGTNDRRFTYDEIDERANAVANELLDLGIEKGDRVSFMIPNVPEFVTAYIATQKLGVVPALINSELKGPTLEHCLTLPDADLLITTTDIVNAYDELGDAVNYDHDPWVIEHGRSINEVDVPEARQFSTVVDEGDSSRPPEVDIPGDHPSAIPYSSGTTGMPKGILNPQKMFHLFGEIFTDLGKMDDGEGYLNALPLFHQGGLWSIHVAIGCRGYNVIFEDFSISEFWSRARKYDCSGTVLVDEMGNWLYNQPEREDDADNPLTWALIFGGPKENREEFERRFDIEYLTLYGMTEVGGIVWSKSPSKTDAKPLSDGRPLTHEVEIVDEHDQELGPGEVGEVLARPCLDNVMLKRYVDMPERTVEAFRNCWYHTGDMGRLDEDGFFYFEGRAEDFIRRKGENISHAEIETVVNDHDDVFESAVIGIPDEQVGEEIKIHVIPSAEGLTAEDIATYCEETLPSFQIPRYFEVMDEFPRTHTERVKKHDLTERGENGLTETTWDRQATDFLR